MLIAGLSYCEGPISARVGSSYLPHSVSTFCRFYRNRKYNGNLFTREIILYSDVFRGLTTKGSHEKVIF